MDSESKEKIPFRITDLQLEPPPALLRDNPNFYYVVFYVRDTGLFLIHGCHATNHADAFRKHPVCLFSNKIGHDLLYEKRGFVVDRVGWIEATGRGWFKENFDLDFIGVFLDGGQIKPVIKDTHLYNFTGHVPTELKEMSRAWGYRRGDEQPAGYWVDGCFFYKSDEYYSNIEAGYLPTYTCAPRDNRESDRDLLVRYKEVLHDQEGRFYVKPEADRARELYTEWIYNYRVYFNELYSANDPGMKSLRSSAFYGFISRLHNKGLAESDTKKTFSNIKSLPTWDALFPYISGAEPWSV